MARFAASYTFKSQTGGINDSQQAVLAASGTASITVGVRQSIMVSVGGTTPTATGLVAFRLSLGSNSTAVSTDAQLPAGVYFFELGDEYDRINLFGVAACVVSVCRMGI